MPTVTNTIHGPDGNPIEGARVSIRLVTSTTDLHAAGFVTASDVEIASRHDTTTNASGVWSVTLEANDNITPAGTVWEVTEVVPTTGKVSRFHLDVPTGGPHNARDILSDPPATVESAALTDHKAVAAAHTAANVAVTPTGNIAATTVQAALAELDSEKLDATTATATYVRRDRSYLNLLDFGAVNGGDIAAALAAARAEANGRMIYLPAGTYTLGTAQTGTPFWLQGDGPGKTVIERSLNAPIIDTAGSIAGTTVALTADAAAGATSITVASTTGIAAGDYVNIDSGALWVNTAKSARVGEIVRVRSVTSATVLALHAPLDAAYAVADSAKIRKLTLAQGFNLAGLTFQHTTQGATTAAMLRARYARNVLVEDVEVRNADGPGLTIDASIDWHANRVAFYDLSNDAANSRFGYGVNVNACARDGRITELLMVGGRHAVTTNAGSGDTLGGVPRHIVVTGGVAKQMPNAAWDTHEEGDYITFIGCQAASSRDTAFHIRSPHTAVIDPIVDNVQGVGVYMRSTATDGMVSGGRISRTRLGGVSAHPGQGVRLEGTEQVAKDLRIEDSDEDCIAVASSANRTAVASSRLVRSGRSGSNNNGIRYAGATTGHTVDDTAFVDCGAGINVPGGATGTYHNLFGLRSGTLIPATGWTAR